MSNNRANNGFVVVFSNAKRNGKVNNTIPKTIYPNAIANRNKKAGWRNLFIG